MRLLHRVLGPWVGLFLLLAPSVRAEEFSILSTSTVLGQNYGAPTGTPPEEDVLGITLVLETGVFLKNLELLGLDDIDGETFFGFLFPLRLRYRAERLSFEAGALLGQNFGDDQGLDIARALLRLTYEPARDVFLVGGTLYPTHWIHEAILDDVQRFRDSSEQGFQFRADRKLWKQDTWINWRIREGELNPEEFEIVNATQFRLFEDILWIDAQLMWAHTGGQKNATDRLENNMTYLAGGSVGYPASAAPPLLGLVDDIRLGGRFLYSSAETNLAARETGSGWEIFGRVDLHPRHNIAMRVHGGYFAGNEFVGWRGDPLYSLDEYIQFGASAVFTLVSGLDVETGFVGQLTDGEMNYSFLVNFAWGRAVSMSFLKPVSPPSQR